MGTRCGDLDPGVIFHVMHAEDLSEHQVTTMLNKHSGLYGISGVSNDMRELLEGRGEGPRTGEARDRHVLLPAAQVRRRVRRRHGRSRRGDLHRRHRRERDPVRERSLAGLEFMGVRIDPVKNAAAAGREADVSAEDASVRTLVIPTNEELIIARDTVRLIAGAEQD